jgi:hypothetical protein
MVQDTVRESLSEVIQEVLHREPSRQEVLPEVLPDGVEVLHGVLPSGDQVLHGHTQALQAIADAPNGGMTGVIPHEVLPGHPSAGMESGQEGGGMTEVLPFDTIKYRLGKLCPRGHDYHGTGQSLRVNNKAGYCLACNAAANQRKREQARQEVSA